MNQIELMKSLSIESNSKIVMLVMDGLGGLPMLDKMTPLERATTPRLDQLAEEGISGMSIPIAQGITPGSGPAHLSLFGYDPFEWNIGRGVLEALGIGFDLRPDDIAARGNFCTIDQATGHILDRRAGRISSSEGIRIVKKLKEISIPGVEVHVEAVRDYRFVLIIRGEGLEDGLTETDPQKTGVPSLPVKALRGKADKAAKVLNTWLQEARSIMADEKRANSCNLRGISKSPPIPLMPEIYKMKLAAIATFPMYRGVAKLVGMDILPTGENIEDELVTLQQNWAMKDFFFLHIKKTDSYGEDGDFEGKQRVIEKVDQIIPEILGLNPDVLIVTGDHSTPCLLKTHSWHGVPTLLWSKYLVPDKCDSFSEKQCMSGGLGTINHQSIMPLLMANSLRLAKYGA